MRGLGYIHDRPKADDDPQPDFAFAAMALRLTGSVPPAHDLSELVVDVLDQGSLGSCTAQAALQAIRMRHVAQGVAEPELGSRLMSYYLARGVEHLTAEDAGTQLRLTFHALNKFGFAPESVWPYVDDGARFRVMPPISVFREAFDQRSPTVYRRITESGAERIGNIKRAVAHGYPVVFGCFVTERFVRGDFDPAKALRPPGPRDDIAGGHAMLFSGYDGDVLTVLNSWGDDFGEDGRVRFSPEYVDACVDLWVVEHGAVEGEV